MHDMLMLVILEFGGFEVGFAKILQHMDTWKNKVFLTTLVKLNLIMSKVSFLNDCHPVA